MKANVDSAGGHHLLKHTAPSIERVVECFDGAPVKEISKLIMRMGQRELQAKFNAVYGTVTRSNNNDWLRRKLFESIGVKTSNKSKTAAKRDNKVGPAKANRITKISKPAMSRSSLSSPDFNEDSAAPASVALPESPATVTHGDGTPHTPFSQQMSPMLAGPPMSAASGESGYMSTPPIMHGGGYPMQRLASMQGPHSGPLPMGCGPVRIVYAPSHMQPMLGGPMQPPMVRLPSSGATSPAQHSFPAAYLMQPMGTPPPTQYGASAGHSGSLSSMVSADVMHQLPTLPYPNHSDGLSPHSSGLVPLAAPSPAPVSMHEPPPLLTQASVHAGTAEDAVANSSDEEHTLTFLHSGGDTACGAEPRAGGKRLGHAVAPAAGAAAERLPVERNPWDSAACEAAELLVSNPMFDDMPLDTLGCGIAAGDCNMSDARLEDGAWGLADIAASSCDEGGSFAFGAAAEFAHDNAEPSLLDSDSHSQLDDAIGSLLDASFSDSFGDTVAQVTRTMTRVGCCLVQWHHKLESPP
eukprot:jgi/Ulvmu1/1908/UM012_0067.1